MSANGPATKEGEAMPTITSSINISAPVETEYTIPVPVLGKLAEKLVLKRNRRESDMSMENIKERLEV